MCGEEGEYTSGMVFVGVKYAKIGNESVVENWEAFSKMQVYEIIVEEIQKFDWLYYMFVYCILYI